MKPRTYHCPVEAAIAVFGGKWKPVILWWLQQRTWRFGELRRQIPEITEKMLKRALQAICDWGRIHMERIGAVATLSEKAAGVSAAENKE
jgi:DNA-binding HxlR family transcriptional regulator